MQFLALSGASTTPLVIEAETASIDRKGRARFYRDRREVASVVDVILIGDLDHLAEAEAIAAAVKQ